MAVDDVERFIAGGSAPQAYGLADAVIAGSLRNALAVAEQLEAHGQRPGRLVFPIVRRVREVHRAARLLDSRLSEAKAAAELRAPPWLAKRTVAAAKRADRASLERALCAFADLEVELRGGSDATLDEDTAFSLALARAAG